MKMDIRTDVPCDMDQWNATRARFPGGAMQTHRVNR